MVLLLVLFLFLLQEVLSNIRLHGRQTLAQEEMHLVLQLEIMKSLLQMPIHVKLVSHLK